MSQSVREKRIQEIKDCGQTVIDSAEMLFDSHPRARSIDIHIKVEGGKKAVMTVQHEFSPAHSKVELY